VLAVSFADDSEADANNNCDWHCSHEAMSDLVALMGSLVDNKGHILIPHIYDSVQPLTQEESSSYDSIDFDMASAYLLSYLLNESVALYELCNHVIVILKVMITCFLCCVTI